MDRTTKIEVTTQRRNEVAGPRECSVAVSVGAIETVHDANAAEGYNSDIY
jgi:hypothetical protein